MLLIESEEFGEVYPGDALEKIKLTVRENHLEPALVIVAEG